MTADERNELALLRETMMAGFARVDHYFELQQAQHLELRADLKALSDRVGRLEQEFARLRQEFLRLEQEFRTFREWTAGEFAEVRLELRRLRQEGADRDDRLRGELSALSQRVNRLEERVGRD